MKVKHIIDVSFYEGERATAPVGATVTQAVGSYYRTGNRLYRIIKEFTARQTLFGLRELDGSNFDINKYGVISYEER